MTKKHHALNRHNANKHLNKQLRFWHRKLGVLSVVFVLLLAITGILINHSNLLSLDNNKVTSAWLLDYYGIKAPTSIAIYQTTPLIASSDNLIWIKDNPPIESDTVIKGMVHYNDLFVAVDNNHLYLISDEGALIEMQDASLGLPQAIEAIGQDGQLWLKTIDGYFTADPELIDWTAATPFIAIHWAKPLVYTQAQSALIALKARSTHLSWERVLLDVHSGRFFGALGPWFMDLVALSLIVMSLSGIYLWQKTKKKKTKKSLS